MTETGFIGRLRETVAGWLRPAPGPTLRQSVIQFSANLPAIIGAPMDDIRPGPQLRKLIGHYGDEVWVYVAVSKVAQSAASVPLQARNGPSEDEDSEVLEDGPLHDLLNRPNLYQSPFDFIEQYQTSMELAGESFILLDRGPSGKAATTAIYILPLFDEQTMTVIRGKTIRPDGPIDGYIYQVQGIKETFLPDEIIHVRYPNPFNPFRGLAPLRAAALSVTADLMAQQYNAAFFTNSAEPRGHYEAEGIVTDAQYKRFQKLIEARHRGYKKAHRPMIFQNMKWVSTQLSPKDAEFLDMRRFSREEIIAIYGVRPVVVGLLEHNPQANAEIQWRDFWTATMQPKMAKLTDRLNMELTPLFGDGLAIEWDFSKVGPLQENFSNKVTDADKLNRMGYPINMINRRLNLGFEDVPWGDTWFVSPLLVPVESMMELNGNGNGNGNSKAHLASSRELQVPSVVTLLPALGGTSVEGRKRAALAAFEIRQTKRERLAQRQLIDFFHAQERRVLRNLRKDEVARASSTHRPASVDLAGVFDIKEETEKMQPVNRGIMRKSVVEAILTFISEAGMNEDEFDFVSPSVLRFLETNSFREAKNITEYTRELLAVEFTEALKAGETIGEISARVERVFDERASSAETIARTETVGASNFGNQEAALQAGVSTKTWVSSRDERVRDEHVEIDDRTTGEPIPVTMPFRLSDGSELMFPGDSSMGAAAGQVINCRCTTIYGFED